MSDSQEVFMKKIVLLFSVLALMASASCKTKEKSKKSTDTTATNSSNNTAMQNEKKYRLVVSFFSIGTGIDGDAMTKLEKFVKNHPAKPVYETFH